MNASKPALATDRVADPLSATATDSTASARSSVDGEIGLSTREQSRNLVLYALIQCLVYSAAPVLYVGLVQAALLQKLGMSATVANLPASVYFWVTPLPILAAWYFHRPSQLKPVLVGAFLTLAASSAALATMVGTVQGRWWVGLAVVVHAALLGIGLGVAMTFLWEALGQGVSPARRGQALALAFGGGPVFALLASLGSQAVLTRAAFPTNFAILFAFTAAAMTAAALLASGFALPAVVGAGVRPSLSTGVVGGLRDFFRCRLFLVTSLSLLLVSSGYNVLTNMALFTTETLGANAEAYVGYENALRFGGKALAGVLFGWLLTRTHPKTGLLLSAGCCLASVVWVLFVPGIGFLLAFGLMGAGELWGVYYPNYILAASAAAQMRRNMAYVRMLNMPSGFAPLAYGAISGWAGAMTGDPKRGFQATFLLSAALLAAGMFTVQSFLPARPQPAPTTPEETGPR